MAERPQLILVLVLLVLTFLSFVSKLSTQDETRASSTHFVEQANNPPGVYPFAPRVSAEDYVASNPRFALDEKGILTIDYGGLYSGLGKWHNPLFVAVYAHALYADFLRTGDKTKSARFLQQANWVESQDVV